MAIKKLPSTGDAPRSTGVPESLVAGGAADSAGFPWAGRTFDHHGTAFADDDGSSPEAVLGAVARLRAAAADRSAATAGDYWDGLRRLADRHADVIAALGSERLLVPMLAEAGDVGLTPEGRTVEKSQELSIVTVGAPDGRRVLPVFTSVDTMRKWHPEARPIPVPGAQVGVAAAQEETDLIMVDAATPELEFGVRRPALRPLATGERYEPAWIDDEVFAEFHRAVAAETLVEAVGVAPADREARLLQPDVEVSVRIAGGLDREALADLMQRLQALWASSEIIAERVDSMRVRPVAS